MDSLTPQKKTLTSKISHDDDHRNSQQSRTLLHDIVKMELRSRRKLSSDPVVNGTVAQFTFWKVETLDFVWFCLCVIFVSYFLKFFEYSGSWIVFIDDCCKILIFKL